MDYARIHSKYYETYIMEIKSQFLIFPNSVLKKIMNVFKLFNNNQFQLLSGVFNFFFFDKHDSHYKCSVYYRSIHSGLNEIRYLTMSGDLLLITEYWNMRGV